MSAKRDGLSRLCLGFGVYQFLLHVVCSVLNEDPRLWMPSFVAFLHDLLVLSVGSAFFAFVRRVLPSRYKSPGEKAMIPLFFLLGCGLSLYPCLLREFLLFPVNVFEASWDTSKTFVLQYLGLPALVPVALSMLAGVFSLFHRREIRVPPLVKRVGFTAILALSAVFLTRPSPNPLAYSLQSVVGSLLKGEKRIVPSLSMVPTSHGEVRASIHPLEYPTLEGLAYDHILILVWEGVTSRDFEREFVRLEGGFYAFVRNQAAYYSNYYSTNLDSYTALIALLTGIHVPYRCYGDERRYQKVNEEKNLVDLLNRVGFTSIFLSTYEHQPFVPVKKYWKKVLTRKDFELDRRFVTLGTSKMEKATEDKVAIDRILQEMQSNPRVFLLHEMVYGHSPAWRATRGKSELAYYNEYLLELYDKLRTEGLESKTLILIVSDHGDRSQSAEMENYRVPLLVVGTQVKAAEHSAFLSHLQFPCILLAHAAQACGVRGGRSVFVVGSSERWTYGQITAGNGFLFIDNARGTVLNQGGTLYAPSVHGEFLDYVNAFNSKYGQR